VNPDPHGYAWCFSKARQSSPITFSPDYDYFISAVESDPDTLFVDQGWWGNPGGVAHCNITGKVIGSLPFPHDFTATRYGQNNAAALLMPDNETLVQFQPLYRCTPGSPVLSLAYSLKRSVVPTANVSILGDGAAGAHGGSLLSSIGGTIRMGELLPNSPPLRHAIKLMLWAAAYYFPGNVSVPCYRWPALRCDGKWNASRDASNPNFYNGSDASLKPGALLAVPPALSTAIRGTLNTALGRKFLDVLTDYGGYLDDNTAGDRGAFNVESGVENETVKAYGPELGTISHIKPGSLLYGDLRLIYQQLHIVENNSPGSVGGGGRPRQPPAPPICP
jgi:hypothetical protein